MEDEPHLGLRVVVLLEPLAPLVNSLSDECLHGFRPGKACPSNAALYLPRAISIKGKEIKLLEKHALAPSAASASYMAALTSRNLPLTFFHLTLKTSPHYCRKYPASALRSETLPIRCLRLPYQYLLARSSGPTQTSAASQTRRAPAPAGTRGTPPAVGANQCPSNARHHMPHIQLRYSQVFDESHAIRGRPTIHPEACAPPVPRNKNVNTNPATNPPMWAM